MRENIPVQKYIIKRKVKFQYDWFDLQVYTCEAVEAGFVYLFNNISVWLSGTSLTIDNR